MANVVNYTDFITSEHADKPFFTATVSALAQPFVDQQNVTLTFSPNFDLDRAFGIMLDYDGQWIGLSRTLRAPITGVYFTLDDATLGFDLGVWKGPNDPTYGLVTLDDETYRSLLKAKALSNRWDGSLGMAQEILALWFVTMPGTLAFVQDNHDMTISIGIAGITPSPLFQFITAQGYVNIRPGGVGLKGTYISDDRTPLFGMDMGNDYIGGFDTGTWGQLIPVV